MAAQQRVLALLSLSHRNNIVLIAIVLICLCQISRAEQPKYSFEYERYPFPPPGLPVQTPNDYRLVRRLGTGKFSDVFEAVDVAAEKRLLPTQIHTNSKNSANTVDPRTLAVVKCLKPVSDRKIRREICVLQHASQCQLPNLTRLLAVVIPPEYYAANRQPTDLPRMPSLVLEHAGPESQWLCHERHNTTSGFLSDYEIRYFLCHLLVALEALHARGIMHRDVKPRNVLINRKSNTDSNNNNNSNSNNNKMMSPASATSTSTYRPLMLIDLGLADFYVPGQNYNVRVASRHYKSPELLLNMQYYDYGLDLWGVGCILAGLLLRREPFFRGKDNPDQLSKIVAVLGTTDLLLYMRKFNVEVTPELQAILDRNDQNQNQNQNHEQRQSWLAFQSEELACPAPPRDGLDLLDKLLVYDHQQRLTAQQAMQHPFFDPVRERVLSHVRSYRRINMPAAPPLTVAMAGTATATAVTTTSTSTGTNNRQP
jgi:casein kinase II subunit alpha